MKELLSLVVWDCTFCGLKGMRRVDAYDSADPDKEACPRCGEAWAPERVTARVKEKP